MIGVNVNKYDTLDMALKAFKSKVRKAHIIELSNQRSHFVSNGERRRRRKRTNRYLDSTII